MAAGPFAHPFPLGVRMSMARRSALLDWAEATGAAVIEDDYDTDFRYQGRPVDPLHALDRSGRVVYVGSFSKTMLPSLRLGYCVAPPDLLAALRKARFVSDWHGAPAPQIALGQFIAEGRLAAHVRSMRRTYLARRDRIVAILDQEFCDSLVRIPNVAGLHVAASQRRLSPTRSTTGSAARPTSESRSTRSTTSPWDGRGRVSSSGSAPSRRSKSTRVCTD